jgi:RNA polymerase sigma factor (sigma-70 family)
MDTDVRTLVAAAAAGDRLAWEAIVDRYAGLVWSVARGLGLGSADAADVSQATWLRLVEHLDRIREPAALGSWLATTARREALALLRGRREVPLDDTDRPDPAGTGQPPDRVLAQERDAELWQAFHALPDRCQALLRLLVLGTSTDYAAASAALAVPVGSIGPTRGRCLDLLRRRLTAVGDGRAVD